MRALIFLIALAVSTGTHAKVSPEEAQKLKNGELTPVGANPNANEDGTIPEWTGGLRTIPKTAWDEAEKRGYEKTPNGKGFAQGQHLLNPFPGDKPLFTISNANLDKHKDKLSDGQIALFEFFDDYKMPVYETRRTAAKPDHIYEEIYKNATRAELVADGEGIANARMAEPFPIPKNGREVIWNHKLRWRGLALRRWNNQFPVTSTGNFNPVKLQEDVYFIYADPTATREKLTKSNVAIYFLQIIRAPARQAGQILLVHETINQVQETRRAWIYNPGQRRVRRAPNVGYDNPGTGSDGLRTNDQFDGFNGAMDRYTWKLKGKKEMYVPYNAYRLHDPKHDYENIMQKRHINQDMTRCELHRVWVVEAEIRDGTSHIYPNRTFYVDEDSWQIVAVDNYDRRGNLWRVQELHGVQAYDPTYYISFGPIGHNIYDLQNSRYLGMAYNNEDEEIRVIDDEIDNPNSYFNPRSIQRFAFQ